MNNAIVVIAFVNFFAGLVVGLTGDKASGAFSVSLACWLLLLRKL